MSEEFTISLEELKREKIEKDIEESMAEERRPVICDMCTKRIGKYYNESYYKIDGYKYCQDCIESCKIYV